LVAMLFLLFDVEAAFLYPWAVQFKAHAATTFVPMLVFFATLLVGFIYVWQKGALEWER
jgi:NADH-quinone oxidoreductase subunit A